MSRETRLLRASLPFLAIGLVFAEGVPHAIRLLGLVGVVLLTTAVWPTPAVAVRETKADRPRAPPELRPRI